MNDNDAFSGLFAPEPETSTPSASAASWKVLLVDDDAAILAALRLALQKVVVEGHALQLLDARSAAEAKVRLAEHPDINLVLLDVVMETELAGLEVVRHIREDLGNRSIQIVLVTGHPGHVAQREVVAAYEIDGFRLKSELTPDNIFAAVYAALRSSRAMRDLEQQRDILREQQEALLRWKHIFEHAEWGIVIGSANGAHIELANPAFARQHGYSPEELIGLPIAALFAPEKREQFLNQIGSNDEPSHQTFESRHLRKDGSTFPVLIDITALKDDLGQVAYRVANVQDITEHKQAEAALKHRQAMLTRTEGIAHVGSWEWDVATDSTKWSDEMFRIFQRDPAEGAPTFAEHPAIYLPEDMQRLKDAVNAALNQGTPYELELRAIRRDGATRVCLARGQVEMDEDKRVTHLFGS